MYQDQEFIEQYAKSGRFTQGRPRNFTITNSNLVLFLRAIAADRVELGLYAFSLETEVEVLLIDPSKLNISNSAALPAAERSRRERMREAGAGITAYSVDENGENLCFALNGILFIYQISTQQLTQVAHPQLIVDPKISPAGDAVAVITAGVSVYSIKNKSWQVLINSDDSNITYGLANFIAAEEFSRISGYWWSDDSKKLLIEKVDYAAVSEVYLSDPTDPANAPRVHRYPFAGEKNPISSLLLFDFATGLTDLSFLTAGYEYLINASFKNDKEIQINLLNRRQNHLTVKIYSIADKSEKIFFEQIEDPWVEISQPLPKFFSDQFIYLAGEVNQKIQIAGQEIPNQDFDVRSVLTATNNEVTALVSSSPENLSLIELKVTGDHRWITPSDKYSSGISKNEITLINEHSLTDWHIDYKILYKDKQFQINNFAQAPHFKPNIEIKYLPESNLFATVIRPSHSQNKPLPVILSPYAGPHAQRVLRTANGYLAEQFLAQQGYVVLVVDGRGTPGRGKAFAQSISSNWAEKVLTDQISALNEINNTTANLIDINNVGIMGWSFGGYLAAYAALTRSDIFKAAIAGAPVTDWRWYDTAYSERYLGLPSENKVAYEENSLINKVDGLKSGLLLIHGLADDNVLAMHSLRLSSALFAKAKAHNFLSLTGVSHMTPQTTIVENLLKQEVDFFNKYLKS